VRGVGRATGGWAAAAVVAAVACVLARGAGAHSYLCEPTTRSNQCAPTRGELVGPCDARVADAVTPALAVARGEAVRLANPRNNHPGGIVRLAWARTADSDDAAAFEERVQAYSCFEAPCDAQTQCDNRLSDDCTACAREVVVPPDLDDGAWTLQWVWYGGGYGLNPYYSCVDFVVEGGEAHDAAAGTFDEPTFSPGDATYPAGPMCWLCPNCDKQFPAGAGHTLKQLLEWSDGSTLAGKTGGALDGAGALGVTSAGYTQPAACEVDWSAPATSGWGWWQLDVSAESPTQLGAWEIEFAFVGSAAMSVTSCWGMTTRIKQADGTVTLAGSGSVAGGGAGTTIAIQCGVNAGASVPLVTPSVIRLNGVACLGANTPTPTEAGEGAACDVTVVGADLAWTDADVTIDAGQTVCWSWDDAEPHNVAQVASPESELYLQGGLYSGAPADAGEYALTFGDATAGLTFHYVCEPHATMGMVGSVTVRPLEDESDGGDGGDGGGGGGDGGGDGGGATGDCAAEHSCAAGYTGIMCYPRACAGTFYQCVDGTAYPLQAVAPGTKCHEGAIVHASTCEAPACDGEAEETDEASASASASASADGEEDIIVVGGNGGVAGSQSCDAGDGVHCWPSNCCPQFYQCAGGVAYPPQQTASGTLCRGGAIVHASDARCENVVCGSGASNDPDAASDGPPSQPLGFCGDGRCSAQESCSSCWSDCGFCEAVNACGDGTCGGAETCASCAYDCGACGADPGDGGADSASGDGSQPAEPAQTNEFAKRMVAYYTNWAQYRTAGGNYYRFLPEQIDATLLTHVVYAFAKVSPGPAFEIQPYEWNDVRDDMPAGHGMYDRFHAHVRAQNPSIKTLIAVGGWNFNFFDATKGIFSEMASSAEGRAAFISSAIAYCRRHTFDGFSLDWEYPGVVAQGGQWFDKENYAVLMGEFRDAIEAEAVATGRQPLLLSAAVAAGEWVVNTAYDVPRVAAAVDWLDLMTYDLHGSWETRTGAHTALFAPAGAGAQSDAAKLTVDHAVRMWIAKGAAPEKIVMGMAAYGRSWTLAAWDAGKTGLGLSAAGAGLAGTYTREKGFLSYYEIQQMIALGGVDVYDDATRTHHVVLGDQWVGYDTPESLSHKVDYVFAHDLGGAMVWALDLDDFTSGSYAIVSSIAQRLFVPTSEPVAVTLESDALSGDARRRLAVASLDASEVLPEHVLRAALSTALDVPPDVFRFLLIEFVDADAAAAAAAGEAVQVRCVFQIVETKSVPAQAVAERVFSVASGAGGAGAGAVLPGGQATTLSFVNAEYVVAVPDVPVGNDPTDDASQQASEGGDGSASASESASRDGTSALETGAGPAAPGDDADGSGALVVTLASIGSVVGAGALAAGVFVLYRRSKTAAKKRTPRPPTPGSAYDAEAQPGFGGSQQHLVGGDRHGRPPRAANGTSDSVPTTVNTLKLPPLRAVRGRDSAQLPPLTGHANAIPSFLPSPGSGRGDTGAGSVRSQRSRDYELVSIMPGGDSDGGSATGSSTGRGFG